jgi:hypothetical protein
MCTECQRLQKKITLYREIVERAIDPLTPERFNGPIKDLEQRKEAVHVAGSVENQNSTGGSVVIQAKN